MQVELLRNSFYTYKEHQIIITNMFGILKVNLFFVMQLISNKIEIVHYRGKGVVIKEYLSFETVKIASISHRFSLHTNV